MSSNDSSSNVNEYFKSKICKLNLSIEFEKKITTIKVCSGTSVRDALDSTSLRVRTSCGGTGACGACLVRFIEGEVNEPTAAEYKKLTEEQRNNGLRLSCQLRLNSDTKIELSHPAPSSNWRSIPDKDLAKITDKLPTLKHHIYGLAIDLGTTHIRLSLWDRKLGKRIASRRGLNPQNIFGADVLNRLDVIHRHPERISELSSLARNAIIEGLKDILNRELGEAASTLEQIGQITLVGNTAMLALVTENGGSALIDPKNWQASIDCQPLDKKKWNTLWGIPNANITIPSPIAGFVGSDLVADLIATNFLSGPKGSLLIDVGTNSEIALWDGEKLQITSVPGGPAFEGGGIRFGMQAETGAIYQVNENFSCDTINGSEPLGFCGSGLTDAISVLLAKKILKPSGRFTNSPGPEGYRLDPSNLRTAISNGDVDAFQRAKAATSAAMAILLKRAGMDWSDLQRLCVCGAFGNTLNINHAQSVGLLPTINSNIIELYADATLSGCERALLSCDGSKFFSDIIGKIHAVNLSLVNEYDDCYIDHLRLRPIPPINNAKEKYD